MDTLKSFVLGHHDRWWSRKYVKSSVLCEKRATQVWWKYDDRKLTLPVPIPDEEKKLS